MFRKNIFMVLFILAISYICAQAAKCSDYPPSEDCTKMGCKIKTNSATGKIKCVGTPKSKK